jgi:hypothetical protein
MAKEEVACSPSEPSAATSWDMHWVQTTEATLPPLPRTGSKPAFRPLQMMAADGQRQPAPIAGLLATKTPDHYDSWRERNVRRLAKQGIELKPVLGA